MIKLLVKWWLKKQKDLHEYNLLSISAAFADGDISDKDYHSAMESRKKSSRFISAADYILHTIEEEM